MGALLHQLATRPARRSTGSSTPARRAATRVRRGRRRCACRSCRRSTQCAAPNRTHGAPLAYGVVRLAHPVVGLSDGGHARRERQGGGLHRLRARPRDPGRLRRRPPTRPTSPCRFRSPTCAGARTSPTTRASSRPNTALRITDKDNGGVNPGATVTDTPYTATIPCQATSLSTIGSTCSLSTTADALVAGTVKENRRTIWELGTGPGLRRRLRRHRLDRRQHRLPAAGRLHALRFGSRRRSGLDRDATGRHRQEQQPRARALEELVHRHAGALPEAVVVDQEHAA